MTSADIERIVKPFLTNHDHLDQLLRRFVTDEDPLAPWRAFWWARMEGIDPPAWTLQYFENAASNLIDLAVLANARPVTDARVAKALGLKGRGGPSVFRRDRDALRDRLILRHVSGETKARKANTAYRQSKRGEPVIETVATAWNTTDHNVKKIIGKGKKPR